jgi:ABC-type branched-subunit amino acid transport system substrate-binding protein
VLGKTSQFVTLLAIFALMVGVAGAQESTEEADCNFAEDPIVIGGLAPLSAPGAVTAGVAMEWSMEQAVEDINADCGIALDGTNYRLQIEVEDSEGSTAPAQLAAERLVESSEVVGVVGVYHSAVGLATMDIFQENQVPVVYSEPWNDNVTIEGLTRFEEDGIDYIFRIAPTSTTVARAAVDWLIAQEIEDVVVIAENTDYGIGAEEQNRNFFEEADIEYSSIFVELGTEDFVPVLSRIQTSPPDAIRIEVTGETGYNLTQQMIELGIAPTEETICNTMQDAIQPEYWEAVPDGVYCAFYKVGIAPANYNDQTRAYVEKYRERFDSEPAGYAMASYDSVFVLADAIERANTTDSEAVVDALEDTDITLTQGRYYFEYTSDNPIPEDSDVPAYMWHQWPDPAVIVIQYTEEGQDPADAPVVWPPAYQTEEDTSYYAPGGDE